MNKQRSRVFVSFRLSGMIAGAMLFCAGLAQAQPANDDFEHPTAMYGSQVIGVGDNTGATGQNYEQAHGIGVAYPYASSPGSSDQYPDDPQDTLAVTRYSTNSRTVWFSWLAPFDGVASVALAPEFGFPMVGSIYSGDTIRSLGGIPTTAEENKKPDVVATLPEVAFSSEFIKKFPVFKGRLYRIAVTTAIPPKRDFDHDPYRFDNDLKVWLGTLDSYDPDYGGLTDDDLDDLMGSFTLSISMFNEAPAIEIVTPFYNHEIPVNKAALIEFSMGDTDAPNTPNVYERGIDYILVQATTTTPPPLNPNDAAWQTVAKMAVTDPTRTDYTIAWTPTAAGAYYFRVIGYDIESDTDGQEPPLGGGTGVDRMPSAFTYSESTRVVVSGDAGPTVSITSPADGAKISSNTVSIIPVKVNLAGTNADDVTRIEIYNEYLSNTKRQLLGTITSLKDAGNYTFNFSPLALDGDYKLRAVAYISDGIGYSSGVRWAAETDVDVRIGSGGTVVVPPADSPVLDNTKFVKQLYRDFYKRVSTAKDPVAVYAAQIQAGKKSQSEIALTFANTSTAESHFKPFLNSYYALKDAAPSYTTYKSAASKFNAGGSVASVVQSTIMGDSTLKKLSDNAFISRVFQNTVGRKPIAQELTYWNKRLGANGAGRGTMVVTLSKLSKVKSANKNRVNASYIYLSLLQRSYRSSEASFALNRVKSVSGQQLLIQKILGSTEYQRRFD